MRDAVRTVFLLLLGLIAAAMLPAQPWARGIAGYLPLHTLLEMIAVIIAMLVFAVGWHAHSRSLPGNIVLLACMLFGVGLLDFSHLLSYAGMPAFVTPSGPEKAINFWLAARLMAAVALLAVALLPWRPFAADATRHLLLAAVIALTGLAYGLFLYHPGIMPRTFIPGAGLTPFKIGFEYALVGINLVTAFALWRCMRRPQPFNAPMLFAAVCTLALSEFYFTLYAEVTDVFNLLGHIYKLIGYLFIYRAIFIETVESPYRQLRAANRQLQATFDAIPDALFEFDRDGRCLECRIPRADPLGRTYQRMIGRTLPEILPPEAAAAALAALREAADSGRSQGRQIDLPGNGDGRCFELSVARKETSPDEAPRFVALARDISERRRAEGQLRKFALAVEQSPESILITDAEGRIEYANEAFVRTTGYAREQAIGANPRLLASGKTPPATYTGLWQALHEGRPWQGEFVNRRQDGSEYVDFAIISPIRQPDGRITHYLAVQQEITERKRLAEEVERHRNHLEALVDSRTRELAEAREKAEAASRTKSSFLANMSHEIRTPMHAIAGLTHLLRRDAPTPAQAEKLDRIDDAADHLLSIINDILDISKIEAGRLVLAHADFPLAAILDNVRSLISDQARDKGLTVHVDCEGAPAWLRGDETRLRQCLLNYAVNAVKFTEQGSLTLRVRVAASEGDALVLRFEVRDTGIGIDAAQLPRLFHAFEQADESTTRRYGGTGLGLVITRRLAEMMGGEVGVDSAPGLGSTFWFTARLERGDAAAATTPTGDAAGLEARLRDEHAGARLLLVEDSPINRGVALALLEGAGLRVDTAEDGLAGVDQARTNDYDLILMDMQMPVMDGLDATRAIRRLPERAATPILAMTANAFEDSRRECLDAGMNDFVAKPVKTRALYAALLKWLPPRRTPRPTAPVPPAPAAEPPATQPFAGIPGLDAGYGLHQLRGNAEKYVHFLRHFAGSHGDDAARIAAGIAAGDLATVARIAHGIKGTAGALGAGRLSECAAGLLAAVHQSLGAETVADRADALQGELAALIGGIRAVLVDAPPAAAELWKPPMDTGAA